MGDFDAHNRKKALAFAEELAMLARRSPSVEIKGKIMSIASHVRWIYGMTELEKIETVFLLIADGAVTVDDLVAETGFPFQKISEIVISLKNMHRVRISTINNGRPGPPRQLIVPTNYSPLKNK